MSSGPPAIEPAALGNESPHVETLQFESARAVESLYGGEVKNLRLVENTFGVKVVARDGWLRIEGPMPAVKSAAHVFTQLDEARRGGIDLGRSEFRQAIRAVQDGQGESLQAWSQTKLLLGHGKPSVHPRSRAQRLYIENIRTHDLVFGIGPAGTGKTYLAMAMAVDALKRGEVKRIILTRPAVEAGEALGFLPGDLTEKIFPYLRPLYDALYDMMSTEEVTKSTERGVVEIAPLAYMRGRTLAEAFVILDEAQNTTHEQMFMFLTRLGSGSRCVVTGDPTQIDLPRPKKSGLIEAMDALEKVDGIAMQFFTGRDVVRHELVQSIIEAYTQHRAIHEA